MAPRLPAFAAAVPLRGAAAATPRRAACRVRACTGPEVAAAAATDKLFSRLSHVNKNLRVKAAGELSRMPPDVVVPRLVALLDQEETAHRRAAVQSLGMVGTPAVAPLVSLLQSSDNVLERASCSKALAAVAMYHPRMRVSFDDDALDAMEGLLDGGVVDPVTKIATVGCLTTLACDQALLDDGSGEDGDAGAVPVSKTALGGEGVVLAKGNERAVAMLVRMLQSGQDIALSAGVCGALAQIANCGTPERKEMILSVLRGIVNSDEDEDEDSGFSYVQEMCKNHVAQLEDTAKP